jgi:dihydrofolate reductase
MGSLLKHDLVDEFRLKIFPITLGSGKRLFAEGSIPAGFNLIESGISPKGVIVADYVRAGDVRTGSFGQEIPSEAERSRRETLRKEAA